MDMDNVTGPGLGWAERRGRGLCGVGSDTRRPDPSAISSSPLTMYDVHYAVLAHPCPRLRMEPEKGYCLVRREDAVSLFCVPAEREMDSWMAEAGRLVHKWEVGEIRD